MSLSEVLEGRTVDQARNVLGDRPFVVVPYAAPRPDPLADEERIVRVRELDDGQIELTVCAFRTKVDG